MKKQILSILFAVILIFAIKNTCQAANASISSNSSGTVGEELTISVKGSGVQWNLALNVNGTTIARSSELENVTGNKEISFFGKYTPTSEGDLKITLTGTVTEAADGSTIRDFSSKTISIKAATNKNPSETPDPGESKNPGTTKSSEARLRDLGITPNDFKGFKRDTTTYNVEVPNNVSKVQVYAKAVDSNAKITGTGTVSLKEGNNTVNVVVTAEDGKTKKTYTLNITRLSTEEPTENSSDARLSNLGIRPKEYDFSGFKKDTTSYSVEVPNDVEEVEVYAESVSSKAKITGTGKVSLKEGTNTINVEVTAEDGTKKTYTINVTRTTTDKQEESQENNETKNLGLVALSIKDLNLSPSFNENTYEYTLGLTEDLDSLEIEAKANNENATIEIIGNEDLKEGENVITILISNDETEEVATYQIIVNKNLQQEEVVKADWLKPSTWGLKQKIIVGVVILLVIIIITVIIIKIRLSNKYEEDDLDLPGADELDRALTEHQELTEEEVKTEQNEKTDIERAQEYFEGYSKRKGKHF